VQPASDDAAPVPVLVPGVAPDPKPEEPKAAARESKKAAAGDTGKLSLDTVPATEVYFGQNKIGDTPLVEVPLPAGHHALQVINDDKGISQSIEVDIRAGQTTKKRIQL
jgi:serine/threonine-protein kinase